ncbi:FAD-dependent monooxygenase [Sphaerisporangium corydalis]|uniref:FAD-dependent monooxygenase n=1 Tax=Sphaerisporangium corydalis TaxID=1441875 RepID=A0ABV9EAS0_9ACTN|nr:FAD-dependent monooxygenase [Sphaerisporangium corydalis]
MTDTTARGRVLISGASIAGPALAYWLRRYGFTPTVVERAPELRTGGYKVDIRGAAVRVVERMGLMPGVRRLDTDMRGGTYVDRAGKTIATMDVKMFSMRAEGDAEIMRGDLSRLLHEATEDGVEYIFGDSITSVTDGDDGVKVTFERTEPRTFDLVVGADGLHSNTRALTFGDESRFIRDLGYYVSIFTIPNYLDLDRWELFFALPGRVTNVYSTGHGTDAKAAFFFSSPPLDYDRRDQARQKALLAEAYAGAGWELPRLMSAMGTAPDFYFDTLSTVTMERWSKGRTVLLGDAAYCASPASGQGTSLALVGAYVLAGELAAAGGDHRAAFDRYEREMRGFVERNQKLADSIKMIVPRSRAQIWIQTRMVRLMPYLPWKGFMIKKILEQITETANAITLRDYDVPVLTPPASE